MNERINQIIEECTEYWADKGDTYFDKEKDTYFDKEKFAELIVGECIRKINDIAESSNNPQPIYRVAVDLLEHFGVEE
jgi:hypothetical protein